MATKALAVSNELRDAIHLLLKLHTTKLPSGVIEVREHAVEADADPKVRAQAHQAWAVLGAAVDALDNQ
jgi:hypothetical protein